MDKSKNCLLIVDRLLFLVVLFVMLVVPITPLIKQGMYIVYWRILFQRNQIIPPKLEQGLNIEV
jgi:hypothetical protein